MLQVIHNSNVRRRKTGGSSGNENNWVDWWKSAHILSEAAQILEKAGAEFIVICTNTMHKVANQIQQKDTKTPLFDTTLIHAEQAALYSIGYKL
ncbi:Asp/Glu/Hydantoin racemase [Clostridium acidisoli DSM 12555]|uniref:Asp/Glu/Hydantoin racemase n=1 Tax=Clostridium acidisoli DSM 12555 TaxID=1121291 RepID=A0A1W1XPU2_9CLOT|nr:Asp/Glu/Hydantoin racemase [Clostridium acidisoli DSM 12555]